MYFNLKYLTQRFSFSYMKQQLRFRIIFILALTTLLSPRNARALDTNRIEHIIGVKGIWNSTEGVFKITSARNDIPILVDGWTMPPFMGLASWAAFTAGMGESAAMVMGDTVLFQDEVNPAMTAALENGLSVTALHNHFFYDEPKVYFMHISGTGAEEKLASGVKKVWDKIKEVRAATPQPAKTFGNGALPPKSSIAAGPIEELLGVKGQTNNGMFKVVIGRTVKMDGMEAGKEMGVNTWAAFAGDDEHALVDGDFAMREEELQPVLKALRGGGVNIVAIHHHMTGETPRIIFLHFWGKDTAANLAKTLKAALGTTQVK
jgi:phosphotransferase system IIB component